jgi:IS605 OrfB family transposase
MRQASRIANMADAITLPTTQRAYTLRLRSAPVPEGHVLRELKCRTQNALAGNRPEPDEDKVRKEFQREEERKVRAALWSTHEAVNKGAKVFGDWLLTLRSGLDRRLADEKVKTKAKPDRDPTPEERKNRRILLALSWLSVEDALGAPRDEALIVAKGTESTDTRERKLADALAAILQARGVDARDVGDPNKKPEDQPGTWLAHCLPSLAARIRDDAVWVNRSAAFDAATDGWNRDKARQDAHVLLSSILGDDFLTLPTSTKKNKKATEQTDEGDEQEERKKAVTASSKGAGLRTRHLFSHLFGEGKPFGKPKRSLALRDKWHFFLKPKIEEAGLPLCDVKAKGTKKSKNDGPAHTELQREMFSKAASRFAQIVTKQRQQEYDRQERGKADEELRKMEENPSFEDALKALRQYCEDYRSESGAEGDFRLRPAQTAGWDRVVQRWKSLQINDHEDARVARIEAVKELQATDENKKFGDPNLFFRLADEEYNRVWWHNNEADHTILTRFVAGMKARSDAERLKVAAYRHPEPYRNPVFCQFGVSRPPIHFRRLKPFTNDAAGNDPRAVGLLLWHPAANSAKLTVLHGISKRLDSEIGSACDAVQPGAAELPQVSRRGRLGSAAAGLPSADTPSRVGGVFDLKPVKKRVKDDDEEEDADTGDAKLKEPKWNGTLMADRYELARVGKLLDKASREADPAKKQKLSERAKLQCSRLRWFLTVTMEMERRGPWISYVASASDQKPFLRHVRKDEPLDKNNPEKGLKRKKGDAYVEWDGWPWQELNKPLKDNKDGTALVEDTSAARAAEACILLSRLPGLRVLSVDLGHRHAAACAVWEALAPEIMKTEIHGCTIIAGDCGPDDLYCHTRQTDPRGKERTTVYRRIGPDALPDGSTHPAPWARLDRQFLIKLQGEDRPARKASPHEIEAVEQFEEWAGRKRSDDDPPRELAVDALMSDTVRTARLALARHARRAKVAYQLTATARTLPGARFQELDEAGRLELLLDTLADWHALATDSRWTDESARQSWNNRLAALAGGFTIEPPQLPAQTQQESAKAERREAEQALRGKLQPLAQLLSGNETLRRQLYQAWCARWSADDDQWKQKLKWLSRWLMPRQLSRMIDVTKQDGRRVKRREPIREAVAAASNVGGLSLTRISTLTEFRRKVQVGYFTRMWPDGSRAEIGLGFGQSTLDTLERMKDQRIKQLASRIVEAALGIGIDQDPVWDDVKKKWREQKRPHQRSNDPRFAPCHAVIIEDLSHYRPEETRTRRENRATMDWKSAETRKRLEDHCQLYGLHLRDVNPQYTSRQDSRTGAPGVRCVDVPVVDFLSKPWWRKQVARAQSKNDQKNKGDARDRYLLALQAQWSAASEEEKARAAPLRIPLDGGEIFVSVDPRSPLAGGIQADLNAAANIGLRALLDPDFPGRWWYVPCDPATHQPKADKVKGCILENVGPLAEVKQTDQTTLPKPKRRRSAKATKEKEVVNLWRDPAPDLLNPKPWCEYSEYLSRVKFRVIQILRERAGLAREDGK